MNTKTINIINEPQIYNTLEQASLRKSDSAAIKDILDKALELKGLNLAEIASLSTINDVEQLQAIFNCAQKVKQQIYGNRLVIFAPLYISNFCSNNCAYCAFRTANKNVQRKALTQSEIHHETMALINAGHKRILLVAGESAAKNNLAYILDSIDTIYKAKTTNGNGAIRRLNVNIAPLTTDEFKLLKSSNIGTYQLFQETYHRQTYSEMHLSGKKADYNWRINAIDRAMQAGIDDVGIGALFGLYDWHFEILALLQHIQHLNNEFGIGPHTLSVPRLEPATGSSIAAQPPYPVSDLDFCKIVAILRLAVPYTGIIMSTRETPAIRRKTFALGVSQISAGSKTDPGGYSESQHSTSQFSLGDHRTLDEVIRDVAELGYLPSFCTACYRLNRTGCDFMDLAKTGAIKNMCAPNGLATFYEYLVDFGSAATREIGEKLIRQELQNLPENSRKITEKLIQAIDSGKRDVFV